MNVLWSVLWKDLRTEWRSRDRVVAMAVFALLVVFLYQLTLPPPAPTADAPDALAPGLLWIAYAFAALLGLNRAFAQELENDALAGLALAPVDRGWIFLGKAAANTVLLFPVQLVAGIALAGSRGLDLGGSALPLLGVVLLGALGICSIGTLFGAMAVRTRYREVMLPLLLLPLLLPVLLGAVRATGSLIDEGRVALPALQLLAVADAVYLILSFLVFEYVLDE